MKELQEIPTKNIYNFTAVSRRPTCQQNIEATVDWHGWKFLNITSLKLTKPFLIFKTLVSPLSENSETLKILLNFNKEFINLSSPTSTDSTSVSFNQEMSNNQITAVTTSSRLSLSTSDQPWNKSSASTEHIHIKWSSIINNLVQSLKNKINHFVTKISILSNYQNLVTPNNM